MKAVAAVSTFNLGAARRERMGAISYEERMKRLWTLEGVIAVGGGRSTAPTAQKRCHLCVGSRR